MAEKIRLGISTCPNDTFAFHAILNRKIDLRGIDFDIELLDIQQLNDKLFNDQLDVAKASFHAAILLADRWYILPVGAALGFGVGPLFLAAEPLNSNADPILSFSSTHGRKPIVLCPGQHTTATLLYQLFFSPDVDLRHVVFSEIMPALENGQADFGVCIHEGRFTWQKSGLHLVADLGELWETENNTPLPLGGLVARSSLPSDLKELATNVIRDSIKYGLANREETLPTMRQYAQEFTDEVLFSHVDLYVNEWTVDLGEVGRESLKRLADLAREKGIVD